MAAIDGNTDGQRGPKALAAESYNHTYMRRYSTSTTGWRDTNHPSRCSCGQERSDSDFSRIKERFQSSKATSARCATNWRRYNTSC